MECKNLSLKLHTNVIAFLKNICHKIYALFPSKHSNNEIYILIDSGIFFIGLRGRLIALPWTAVNYDFDNKSFIIKIDKTQVDAKTLTILLSSVKASVKNNYGLNIVVS